MTLSLFRDETASIQEKVDRDLAVLRRRLVDVEKARSQILEGLNRIQYQLSTVGRDHQRVPRPTSSTAMRKNRPRESPRRCASEVETLMASSRPIDGSAQDPSRNISVHVQGRMSR